MIKFQLDAYLRSPGLSVKNKLCFGVNVRPEENTNGNGTVRFKTDNNWWTLYGIKYFATAHPSKTKINIVNIKQLPICRT